MVNGIEAELSFKKYTKSWASITVCQFSPILNFILIEPRHITLTLNVTSVPATLSVCRNVKRTITVHKTVQRDLTRSIRKNYK